MSPRQEVDVVEGAHPASRDVDQHITNGPAPTRVIGFGNVADATRPSAWVGQ